MDMLKIGIVVADSDEYKPLLNFIEKTNYNLSVYYKLS